ncbi:MAG: tRNA (N(6)-L-threonylcarbamoyladenosine(37)-C(2))-methylthiotransferase MtaB [Candidatus Omnitrophica bacterium]|nr:tRNA (N(6)-L-threonylcarbamoyladenosine(37)-C(2))-methylthiotransferase MtaB [Candidatus Omnitrophota bacterium]
MKKVIFQTLGCKVNQYETQGMREKLLGADFIETGAAGEADLLVLNTCTVTGEADKKNRYWIRRMRRLNPNAKIVVTGCYAEKNREEILQLEGVTAVLGQNEKDKIQETVWKCFDINEPDFNLCRGQEGREGRDKDSKDREGSPGENRPFNRLSKNRFSDLSISNFEGHARAFVKIQDGCNHACSFCKVVIVRGRSRSRQVDSILEEVKRLVMAGFREVVLTGIQLGAYGRDISPQSSLVDLASAILQIEGLERLRLSSIEPTDVTEDLIDLMVQSPKFAPHLHIPLQSGDDEILGRMRRRYHQAFYRNLACTLKSRIPDFALTTDVMCGFPGETSRQFENTLQLLTELAPLKVHAFPYSRREGTLASRFQGEVSKPIVESRMSRLIQEAGAWQHSFLSSYLGKTLTVLVEEKVESNPGTVLLGRNVPNPSQSNQCVYRGRTKNYILVEFEASGISLGDFVPVQFENIINDRVWGKTIALKGLSWA